MVAIAIFVCNDTKGDQDSLTCLPLLQGEGILNGIAVDPTEGYVCKLTLSKHKHPKKGCVISIS